MSTFAADGGYVGGLGVLFSLAVYTTGIGEYR